jgi:hypothetical protein
MAKKVKAPSAPDEAVPKTVHVEKSDERKRIPRIELLRLLCEVIEEDALVPGPQQSIEIVALTVGANTTLAKDIGGDQATMIDMTPGPLTVVGTCVNLGGDNVQGMILGLDTNLQINQNGLTQYPGPRRWSLTLPNNAGIPAGQYPVVLQVCFASGSPSDSVSFTVRLPGP